MDKIRVLFVDDHPIVRKGLVSLMSAEKDILVVGEGSDGDEAIKLARSCDPSIVIMDLAMPHKNGLYATTAILKENPKLKVIILSMSDEPESVRLAIQAGVSGYVVKQSITSELLSAIREVSKGNAFFSPSVAKVFLSPAAPNGSREWELTLREREVLHLVAQGKSSKEISTHLEISVKTVEKYRQQIMDKLGIHEVAGLTKFAISKGIAEL
jgi:DNA-binding NarL/FixJ family response regulator